MQQRPDEMAPGQAAPAVRPRRTAVVADDGHRVALVLLEPDQAPVVGSRFDHGGRWWVIRGRREHSRVLVAEPVADHRHNA